MANTGQLEAFGFGIDPPPLLPSLQQTLPVPSCFLLQVWVTEAFAAADVVHIFNSERNVPALLSFPPASRPSLGLGKQLASCLR